jgi:hypothetical protein
LMRNCVMRWSAFVVMITSLNCWGFKMSGINGWLNFNVGLFFGVVMCLMSKYNSVLNWVLVLPLAILWYVVLNGGVKNE